MQEVADKRQELHQALQSGHRGMSIIADGVAGLWQDSSPLADRLSADGWKPPKIVVQRWAGLTDAVLAHEFEREAKTSANRKEASSVVTESKSDRRELHLSTVADIRESIAHLERIDSERVASGHGGVNGDDSSKAPTQSSSKTASSIKQKLDQVVEEGAKSDDGTAQQLAQPSGTPANSEAATVLQKMVEMQVARGLGYMMQIEK